MSKRRAKLIPYLTLLSLATAGPLAAQDPPGAEAGRAAPPRYRAEVIIFRYAEDVSTGTEIFLPEEAPAQVFGDEALTEVEVRAMPLTADELRLRQQFRLETTPASELTMTATRERLERLDAYEPLLHVGWTQTVIDEKLTPALPLARFGAVPDGLDGELTLYLSRFLHLVVDISLAAPDDGVPRTDGRLPPYDEPVAIYGDRRQQRGDAVDAYADRYLPLRYRIVENRILKSDETRYYDHPKFGVIATVTRVEEKQERPAAEASAAR